MPHVDATALHKLARGDAPDGEAQPWRAHLGDCQSCAQAFERVLVEARRTGSVRTRSTEVERPLGAEESDAHRQDAEGREDTQSVAALRRALPPRPAPEPVQLGRGDTVGRYVVVNKLGSGGMGVVFLAYDPELDRRVAVKLLRPGRSSSSSAEAGRQRLLREAQALAKLSHPNVVAVFDVGVFQDSVFMAMEYVPGETLARWLKAEKRDWREVLARLVQAGRGIAAAHAVHLIHRDIKPGNILLGQDGRVRVGDFGLVRTTGAPSEEPADSTLEQEGQGNALSGELTEAGSVVGTVGYMAPEQVTKECPVDEKVDQFAFALTLYEALYGYRAFTGANAAAVTAALLLGEPRPPPKDTAVPTWVHRILLRALARKPSERYDSMETLLAELTRDHRGPVRRSLPWLVGAAALGLALTAGYVVQNRRLDACAVDARVFSGAWDAEVRTRLRAIFEGSGKPFAAAAFASVSHRLDAYVAEWSQRRRELCEASLRGEAAPDARELTEPCLDVRLRELKVLTAALATPDAIERSVTAAWNLPAVDRCADLAALRKSPVREGSAADSAERALADEALFLRAMVDSGQLTGALTRANSLLERARQQKSVAVEAAAWTQLGVAQQQLGRFPEAEVSLKQAVVASEGAVRDDEKARAAMSLALVLGFNLHRPEEGRWFERYAEAALARAGGDPTLDLSLQSVSAALLTSEDRPQEAVAAHRRTLERAIALWGKDSPLLWLPYQALATSLVNVRDFEQAVPLFEKALAIKRAAQGDEHPDVALIRSNLGNAYFFTGRTEDAFHALEGSLALRERIMGAQSPRLLSVLNNLADIETKVGRLEVAAVHSARALALAEKLGPTHPLVFIIGATQAELDLAAGRIHEAVVRLDALLALTPQPPATVRIALTNPRSTAAVRQKEWAKAEAFARESLKLEKELGKDNTDLVVPLVSLGAALLEQRRPAEALEALERAVAIAEKGRAWAVLTADAKLALARALARTQREATRRAALAAQAQASYLAAGVKPQAAAEAQALMR